MRATIPQILPQPESVLNAAHPIIDEGELTMDHITVVREKMTEKYLLNELDPVTRDQFEEHYFDCSECARDISAGAQFVEQAKSVLAENAEPARLAGRQAASRGWFAWFRPAFAVPALALLLAIVGYQNLVTYPKLQSELNRPRVLPAVSVNLGTWGAGGTPTAVPEGKGLLLFVRIPPDGS
jgi:anti-sigma factor RsiW